MKTENLLICTDAYKASHYQLYPQNAEAGRWYMAPRKPLDKKQKEFILFGLTYFIEKFLLKPITQRDIDEAHEIWDQYGIGGGAYPFPYEGFQKIIKEYKGALPITIKAIPEGQPTTDYNIPVIIVECLDKDLFWLPGFIETAIQRYTWYGSTVGTNSRNVRKYLKAAYEKTVDEDFYWTLDYRLHDFGARGASSGESAALGGAAHLINFNGSDTMEAVWLIKELYQMAVKDIACSIPAAEHSTITSHGKDLAAEKGALLQMLDANVGPLMAFVSDSYDYKRLVDQVWCDPEVIAKFREKNITPVIRPDSGDPIEMVMYALNACEKAWGVTVNAKGYKVLNGINVIQGDGMDYAAIIELYDAVILRNFSPQNLAVGMGGGLLQKVNRDNMSWSMKMFQIKREGLWYNVQKDPITAANKKGWNPENGLDESRYIVYYKWTGTEVKVLPNETLIFDFAAIRGRARA
jgi:nicotinamide phosphoribosyltransferase